MFLESLSTTFKIEALRFIITMYYVNPKVSGDQKLTAAADITIYPNPTGDFININAAEGFLSVSVHNMSGQRLINHNGNVKRVDVQSISNGIIC